jgi:Domain of unknown function (DUF4440)
MKDIELCFFLSLLIVRNAAYVKKEYQVRKVIFVVASVIVILSEAAFAGVEIADVELRQSVNELSASTLVGGEGWKAYDRLLHPNYSRWAMGEVYERRTKFVKSLEEWWNYGMRVTKRDVDIVAVDMVGDLAIIRYKTTETFIGPDGPVDGFSGYVSNIWIKEDGDWLLLTAEISSTARAD